jgi:hypothetical protein
MSRLQNNHPEWAETLMDRLGIRYRPDAADMARAELKETLLTLRSFVEQEGYFYSIVNRVALDANQAESLLKAGGIG